MKKLIAIMVVFFFVGTSFAQIAGTAHDFSGRGWNGSGEICIVCHTPHNADVTNVTAAPLWNHAVTSTVFTLYNSATFDGVATITQPDGASKLCLSCHDGTVGVDNFGGSGTNNVIISGDALIGTDLSDDHPVSFDYTDALATTDVGLYAPTTTNSGLGGSIDDDLLFANKMECASCHNVHSDVNGNFLRMDNAASAFCLTCHNK